MMGGQHADAFPSAAQIELPYHRAVGVGKTDVYRAYIVAAIVLVRARHTGDGYGKIRTPETAQEMLDAGASLLAITTGLVLDGPSLITKILKYLDKNESQKAGNQA